MPRRVGILGGMGPEATVLLMQRLLVAAKAVDDAGHVPLIVDQNPQVPSRIAHLIDGTGEDPGPVLAGMARRLQRAGATALAMPCNTAHHYAPAIRGAVTVPFLDMVAASVARIGALVPAGGTVGILGSPALERAGIFTAAFAPIGVTARHAPESSGLLAAIRAIKSAGPTQIAQDALRAASAAMVRDGIKVQLIACTEFSLIAGAAGPAATVIDTLDVLVDEIIAFSLHAKASE